MSAATAASSPTHASRLHDDASQPMASLDCMLAHCDTKLATCRSPWNHRFMSRALVSTALAFVFSCGPSVTPTAEITTDKGVVRGKVEHDVQQFLGIPFAAPPVGGLRFKPPRTATRWSGVRE